jgi:hypothetical protein
MAANFAKLPELVRRMVRPPVERAPHLNHRVGRFSKNFCTSFSVWI